MKLLEKFNITMTDLKADLQGMKYDQENFTRISILVNNAVLTFSKNMKKKIEQLRNQTPTNPGNNVDNGISLMNYLLRYFENTHIVSPIFFDTVRQRIQRYSNINNVAVFFYSQHQFKK
jgi:hypothetical protein